MSGFLPFVLGFALAGALGGFGLAVMRGRESRLRGQQQEALDQAEKAFELIASYPHGLLIRDFTSGRDIATVQLTDILGLRVDSERAFDDLCDRLSTDDAAKLRAASSALTQHGKAYVLDVKPEDADVKVIRLVGKLSSSADGKPLAQVIWAVVPDAKNRATLETSQPMKARAFTIPQGDDRVAVETLLDILPFPAWRRDQALDPVYINAAGRETKAVEAATDLARTALEEGTQARATWPSEDGASDLSIIEAPLDGAFGTIGFALSDSNGAKPTLDGSSYAGDAIVAHVLGSLPQGIAIFDATQKLQTYNSAYRTLWALDESWLKAGPGFRQILDRLREQRLLPEFPDYRSFRDEQSEMFSLLKTDRVDEWHLPDGRTVLQTARPGTGGGLVLIYEDVSTNLVLERAAKSAESAQADLLNSLSDGVVIFAGKGSRPRSNVAFTRHWPMIESATDLRTFLDQAIESLDADGKTAIKSLRKGLKGHPGPIEVTVTKDGLTLFLTLRGLADESIALITREK